MSSAFKALPNHLQHKVVDVGLFALSQFTGYHAPTRSPLPYRELKETDETHCETPEPTTTTIPTIPTIPTKTDYSGINAD